MNIGIGALWDNYAHSKITVIFLVNVGVDSCPGVSNQCMLGLAYQQSWKYFPATELDIIRFWPFPFRYLMWHLSTQVNDGILSTYMNVSDPSRGKRRCFSTFLVYALVYLSIASILVTLDTLSHWSEYFHMHT